MLLPVSAIFVTLTDDNVSHVSVLFAYLFVVIILVLTNTHIHTLYIYIILSLIDAQCVSGGLGVHLLISQM